MGNGATNRLSGMEWVIILILGLFPGYALWIAAGSATKFVLGLVLGICGLAAVVMIPRREDVFLFGMAFAWGLAVDINLVYYAPDALRPLNGLVIGLFDVPFAVILFLWLYRVWSDPAERINFYWPVTLTYLFMALFALPGLGNSTMPKPLVYWVVFLIFKCWLVFLFIANIAVERKKLLLILFGILAVMLLQASLGYLQYAAGRELGLGFLGETQQGVFEVRSGLASISRVAGTFGSPNRMASALGGVLPILLAVLFVRMDNRLRWLLSFSLIYLFAMEILTYSRGGWVALFCGGGVTLYWCLAKMTKRKVVSALLLLFFIGVFVTTALLTMDTLRRRLFGDDYGAAYVRLPLAQVAENIIRDKPWFGAGLGEYTVVAPFYDNTDVGVTAWFNQPVHTELLLMAAEQGIPSTIFFLLNTFIVLYYLFKAAQPRGDPLIELLAVGIIGAILTLSIHFLFEFQHTILTDGWWLRNGLAVALYAIATQTKRESQA